MHPMLVYILTGQTTTPSTGTLSTLPRPWLATARHSLLCFPAQVLFLLNLSNIVINWEGRQLLEEEYWSGNTLHQIFTWHTLGNSDTRGVLSKGGHSYAVCEFVTSFLLVVYLFALRGGMRTIRRRIRQKGAVTAAEFTLMVRNVPTGWTGADVRSY